MTNSEPAYFGLFNDSFPPAIDGVSVTVCNYAKALKESGLEPLIVAPANPNAYESPFQMLRYFSVPVWRRAPYRYGYPRLDRHIWANLRKHRFQIVHSHSPFSAGRLAIYTAKYHNVPLIGTFHSKYRTDLERAFKHMPCMISIAMRMIRSFYEQCDEIWIPQALVEETVRDYGIQGKVRVVENGNDFADRLDVSEIREVKAQARRKISVPDKDIALLFVGQHIWEKGIGVILDALSILNGRVPFTMNYIGTGYAREALEAEIVRRGLAGKVHVRGMLDSRDQLAEYYAGSDLFLFPSFYDNAPLVVREAAAFGTPSVLPKGSTAAEIIRDSRNGFLTGRDATEYAAIIEKLYGEPETLKTAGLEARNSLVRGWRDVMNEVCAHYNSLIEAKNRN